MGVLWEYYGTIMVLLWYYLGTIMGLSWDYYGTILELLRYYQGTSQVIACCPEVPYAGPHLDWGGTRAGKIGRTGSSVSVEGAGSVPPVHTSSVKVRRQVFEVSKNRRPKAYPLAHPLNRGRSKPCSTAR